MTPLERELIADLLKDGLTPQQAAFLVGRGVRTVYYLKAELKKREDEKKRQSFTNRLIARLRGFYGSEEREVTTVGTRRRTQE